MTVSDNESRNHTPTDDAAFVESLAHARNGDARALNELIATWRTFLLFVANDEIDPQLRPKLGASDLVQTACLEIQLHLDDFRGTTVNEWRLWLRRLLMNDLYDARRRYFDADKRAVSRERRVDGTSGPEFRVAASDRSPRSEMIAREEWELMHSALQRLSAEYREVLRLRNWEQLPFAMIGTLMGRSDDAAQKLWTRAIVALQTELDQETVPKPEA